MRVNDNTKNAGIVNDNTKNTYMLGRITDDPKIWVAEASAASLLTLPFLR